MALRHEHNEPAPGAHDHAVVAESASIREPIGVAQALAVAIGVFFIVVGAIGLARTGTRSMTAEQAEVAGLGMTGLLALIHLGVGLFAAIGAATRGTARGIMFFLGPALIALGIIALVEPVRQLGWNGANGIAYLIIGVASVGGALLTPVAAFEQRLTERRTTALG